MSQLASELVPSRQRSTWITFAGNQGLVLLNIVRNLVLIPVYLKYIPVEIFGVWLAFAGAVTIVGMADLGINGLIIQRTAGLYGEGDYIALGRTITSSLATIAILSVLACLIIWAICPWMPGWLGVKGENCAELVLAFRLAGLDGMLSLSSLCMGGILLGLQRPAVYMTSLLTAQLVGIAVTLLALWAGWGVLAIPIGMLLGTCLNLMWTGITLRRAVTRIMSSTKLQFDLDTLKELLKSSSLLLIARLCRLIINRSNGIIVAVILSAPLVVVFEITRKTSVTLADLLTRMPLSLLAGLSHLVGTGETERFRRIILLLFRFTIILGISGLTLVILLNREFVSLWTGEQFYGGNLLNLLFGTYALLFLLNIISFNIIFAAGHLKLITAASLTETFLQLTLSIVLGHLWGLWGIVLASVIAGGVVLVIQGLWVIRLLGLHSWAAAFSNSIGGAFLFCIVQGILGWSLTSLVQPRSWLKMVGVGGAYILLAGILLITMDRQLRQLLLSIMPLKNRRPLIY